MLTLKFMGSMRHFLGKRQFTIDYESDMSLKDLVAKIGKETPQLEKQLCNPQADELLSNALILVNGKEISVLNGLDTKLHDDDEIVFIPVVHGG